MNPFLINKFNTFSIFFNSWKISEKLVIVMPFTNSKKQKNQT